MNTPYPSYNCPACGGPLELHFRYTKMLSCPHCNNLLFLEDEAVKLRGEQSVMADYPSLFQLHQQFRYKDWTFTPVGRARFEYAHGYWDEWWAVGGDKGKWVSVDEGDIAIEEPVKIEKAPHEKQLKVGEHIDLFGQNLLITEAGQAKCIGVEGELPEILAVGDHFIYYHLSGSQSKLYTLEIEDGKGYCYEGRWVDPFKVKAI